MKGVRTQRNARSRASSRPAFPAPAKPAIEASEGFIREVHARANCVGAVMEDILRRMREHTNVRFPG